MELFDPLRSRSALFIIIGMLSVLVASHSENIRNTLKNQLSKEGSYLTFEASTFLEAEQILASKGGQISFIVSDFDSGNSSNDRLANYVSNFPEYDSIPFLKTQVVPTFFPERITTDQRVDAYISKPFRHAALKDSMSRASLNLLRKKSTLLYFSTGMKLNDSLLEIENKNSEKYHWKQLIKVESFADFQESIKKHERTLGGVLFDPDCIDKIPPGWLNSFQKTRLGCRLSYVCLSRDPAQIGALRTHCQFFWNEAGSETELSTLSERTLYRFEFKILHEIVHFKTGKKPVRAHLDRITRMIRHDHAESLCIIADAYEQAGKREQARQNYIKAIEANPCNPRAYIKLFPLLLEADRSKLHNYIKLAIDYCPRSPEVIKHASRFQSLNSTT